MSASDASVAEARARLGAVPAPPLGRARAARPGVARAVAAHAEACAVLARAGALPRGAALARLLRTGPATARAYARLARLEPALLAAVAAGELPAGVAAEVARLPGADDRLLLATLACAHGWGVAGEDGVAVVVRMVCAGRSLADVLAARHGISVCEPAPWSVLLVVSWADRARLQRRAWLAGTDSVSLLARDVLGTTHAELDALRRRLDAVSALLASPLR